MSTVYVRWYGQVLHGEVVENKEEGLLAGMVAVRIQIQGMHATALFMPDHVYDSPEQIAEKSSIKHINQPELCAKTQEIYAEQPKNTKSDVLPADDRSMIETFKRENWDHEHNHLRTDKLDEFYKLWRMVMVPPGYVEAEAPKRIVSDEQMEELKEKLKEALDKQPAPQPTQKTVSQKPSPKMLRSTGQQKYNDSIQLSLFD